MSAEMKRDRSNEVPVVGAMPPNVKRTLNVEERHYIASQRQLIWRKFKKHRLAVLSAYLLFLTYLVALTFEFLSSAL